MNEARKCDSEAHQMVKTRTMHDEQGLIPRCQFCKADNCYSITVGQDGMIIKNAFMDGGKYICIDCWEWMVRSGRPVTKLLHTMLWLITTSKRMRL